ncbi:hypothetical protein I3842_01G299400 [Carya illinoinensis]|uniref:Uncharacterized protein n=1 Tax=Carya illinoinensis TaxID=32201 RepID=A0A922G542_CARIL|nr:hypothetical protein I3842_01G299400 [Carya illinoinensis]
MARKIGTSLLVELLTSIGLPHNKEVMVVPLPLKFWVPFMEMYDNTWDPLEHLRTFRAHMTLHSFSRKVAYRAFPLTLKGLAKVWFRSLAPGSMFFILFRIGQYDQHFSFQCSVQYTILPRSVSLQILTIWVYFGYSGQILAIPT